MIYTKEEIEILREGGRRLATILHLVAEMVDPGVKIFELNEYADKLVRDGGDLPAFLNYKPDGAKYPYPSILCVSVNDEVVHGISADNNRVLNDGDIVSLDLGLCHGGLFTDMAITVGVGEIGDLEKKLIKTTEQSLLEAVKSAKAGNHIGDIGFAIKSFVKPSGFGIVTDLGGHGVGKKVHEIPFIPNVGQKGKGDILKEGMVLALEPMLNEGSGKVFLDNDGYTYKTVDGKKSAHFEHTIVVTKNGGEILTKNENFK